MTTDQTVPLPVSRRLSAAAAVRDSSDHITRPIDVSATPTVRPKLRLPEPMLTFVTKNLKLSMIVANGHTRGHQPRCQLFPINAAGIPLRLAMNRRRNTAGNARGMSAHSKRLVP